MIVVSDWFTRAEITAPVQRAPMSEQGIRRVLHVAFGLITCAEDSNENLNDNAITHGNGWVREPEIPWNFVLCPEIMAHVHEGT